MFKQNATVQVIGHRGLGPGENFRRILSLALERLLNKVRMV